MLVLRLQTPDDTEPAWALLNGAAADWAHGSWETLLPLARGQQLVLLIPCRDVLLTSTTINTRNQRQLKQALPYALEDSLASDPEDQHIVWQARADGPQVDVAIIAREHLRTWLNALQAHQLRPNAILPDIFALPWEADSLTLWQQGEQIWIRTGELSGLACTNATLPFILDNLRTSNPVPLRLRLYSDRPITWADEEHYAITPEPNAEQLQATSLQSAMPLNLLRGWQDESNNRLRQEWKRWRIAAILAISAILLGLGLYGVDTYRLQKQLDTLDADNLRLFSELFPNTSGVDARGLKTRVESELLSLRGKAGKTGTGNTLAYLSTFAEALAKVSGLTVEDIRSQSGSLSVELQTDNQQAVEDLRKALESAMGESVELRSSRSAGKVKANLTLGGNS